MYRTRQFDWSALKKEWCCRHENRGCGDRSEAYDCEAGFSKWRSGWSEGKKVWCCQHENKACEERPSSKPYDCEAGFDNWKSGWSEGKKVWCCRYESKGCDEHPRPQANATFDCADGIGNTKEWAADKKGYCCSYAGIACGDEPPGDAGPPGGDEPTRSHSGDRSDPFDCYSGYVYTNWKKTWSSRKKRWCCKHDRAFCSPSEQEDRPPPHDHPRRRPTSTTGPESSASDHQPSESEHRSSHIVDASLYDCSAGAHWWRHEWSVGKKVWCCLKEGKACQRIVADDRPPGREHHAERKYHCDSAADNWQMDWSVGKKEWCCRRGEGGCSPSVHGLFEAAPPGGRPARAPARAAALPETPPGSAVPLCVLAAVLVAAAVLVIGWGRRRRWALQEHRHVPLES